MTAADATLAADPLSQILALLPAELGEWLTARLETPRERQARTLDERDSLVRHAVATHYQGWRDHRAATALATEIRTALRVDVATGERASLIQRIVHLSAYKSLEARQITYILKGRRS